MRRYFRNAILALMFLLAGTANCFCASYDADPNDDIPPVVLEFNYLVPRTSAVQLIRNYSTSGLNALATRVNSAARSYGSNVSWNRQVERGAVEQVPPGAAPLRC